MSYNDPYLQFSADTTAKTFKFNHDEAQLARNFQKEMSSTSHQMEVADLQKAGLNPVLSANGGATAYGASQASGQADSSGVSAKAQVASAALSAQATMYSADAARDSSLYGLLGQYLEAAGLSPQDIANAVQENGINGAIQLIDSTIQGPTPVNSGKSMLSNTLPGKLYAKLTNWERSHLPFLKDYNGSVGDYDNKGQKNYWSKLSNKSKEEWLAKGYTPYEYNAGRAISKFKKDNPYMWYVGGKNGLVPYIDSYAENRAAGTSAKASRRLNRAVYSSIRAITKHASRNNK